MKVMKNMKRGFTSSLLHGEFWPTRMNREAVKAMKRLGWLAQVVFMSFMTLMVHSSGLAQQKPPVFRTRIDLMQLDVTVLDKNGQPVRGLTKDDFTLLEDNWPQTIEGFTAVDLADVVTTGPVWATSCHAGCRDQRDRPASASSCS